MVDGATDVSCLEEEIILYFHSLKWQLYSCQKKAWKKRVKVASKTAMIYF